MTDAVWDERFEEVLRPVLRHLPADEALLPGTDLASVGLDSMASVELLLSLEDHYGVSLPDELLTNSTFATPASLWQAVASVRADGAV